MFLKFLPFGAGFLLTAALLWGSGKGLSLFQDKLPLSEKLLAAEKFDANQQTNALHYERVPAALRLDETESVRLELDKLPLEDTLPLGVEKTVQRPETEVNTKIDKAPGILSPLFSRALANLNLVLGNLLKYRTVELDAYRLKKEELLVKLGLAKDPWVWQLSPIELRQKLLQLPWVEEAVVELSFFPLRLLIKVREAEPWLVARYRGYSWLVSSAGELLEPLEGVTNSGLVVEAAELMRLDGLDKHDLLPNTLSSPNSRFVHAVRELSLFELAGGFPFRVEKAELLEEGALALEPYDRARYPLVLLQASSLSEAEQVLLRLRQVLADLENRRERARKIDLRFRSQVVVE